MGRIPRALRHIRQGDGCGDIVFQIFQYLGDHRVLLGLGQLQIIPVPLRIPVEIIEQLQQFGIQQIRFRIVSVQDQMADHILENAAVDMGIHDAVKVRRIHQPFPVRGIFRQGEMNVITPESEFAPAHLPRLGAKKIPRLQGIDVVVDIGLPGAGDKVFNLKIVKALIMLKKMKKVQVMTEHLHLQFILKV